jgi:hypothetical protein
MRKARKTNNKSGKNIRLGLYFGAVVIFIIAVSVIFKVFDSIKKSTFDGKNFYTVAVLSDSDTRIISVSPKDNSLKKLILKGVSTKDSLENMAIPIDSEAYSGQDPDLSAKSYFAKMLFRQNNLKSNLTTFDLIRLSFFSITVDSQNISQETLGVQDDKSEDIIAKWFIDPEIEKEQVRVEIVNTTDVSGLGAWYADIITNAGGNVVLVHSAREELDKSVIHYEDESYTKDKISRLLKIPAEKKVLNSVSDIVIKLGKDVID